MKSTSNQSHSTLMTTQKPLSKVSSRRLSAILLLKVFIFRYELPFRYKIPLLSEGGNDSLIHRSGCTFASYMSGGSIRGIFVPQPVRLRAQDTIDTYEPRY